MAALPLAARPATDADDDFFARSCNSRKAGPTLLPKNFIAVLAPALFVFEGRTLFLAATTLQEAPAGSCPFLPRSLNPPNRVLPEGASGVNENFDTVVSLHFATMTERTRSKPKLPVQQLAILGTAYPLLHHCNLRACPSALSGLSSAARCFFHNLWRDAPHVG